MGSLEIAQFLLVKAVDLDEKNRWTESLNYYQEGITALLKFVQELTKREDQKKIRDKIEVYIGRAEKLKEKLEVKKKLGDYHEQIVIENNAKGFSYDKIFSRFFDENVVVIDISDAYIHNVCQCYNFLQFCELAVKSCNNLKTIKLVTTYADKPQSGSKADRERQQTSLKQIETSLRQHKVTLSVTYSNVLHDREIVLSNGWIIKIGRGLDYFKHVQEFSIGFTDLSLRTCKETKVDIFHKTSLIK